MFYNVSLCFLRLAGTCSAAFAGRLKELQASGAACDFLFVPVSSMAPHLTPAELDFAHDLAGKGKTPIQVHTALARRRGRQGIATPLGRDASAPGSKRKPFFDDVNTPTQNQRAKTRARCALRAQSRGESSTFEDKCATVATFQI